MLVIAFGFVACTASPDERRSAIYDLREEPSEDNVARIRTLLADPDRDVRATALHAVVSLELDDAAEVARAALDDSDGFVRATAAKLLGDLGDPAHAPVLAGLVVRDPDPIVRQRAATALGELGGPAALEGLREALADPIEPVRRAAVEAVADLDPRQAKAELSQLLLEDPSWEVRVRAARALGTTADPAVLPVLEAALADENEYVRSAVSNALEVHRALTERAAG